MKKLCLHIVCLVLVVLPLAGFAQLDGTNEEQNKLPPVEIDFLSSYYRQEGDNSAVTGGEGTEELKDYASKIKIFIPLKKDRSLNINSGISYFTSASSDNINPNTISSASARDVHVDFNATITRTFEEKGFDYNVKLGIGHEAHFASFNAGFGGSKTIDKWQGRIGFSGHFYYDVWGQYYELSKLYPNDYTGNDQLDTDKRYAAQLGISYQQIFNKKLQGSISVEAINQFGLLSIPFHRIYFMDDDDIDLERLPDYKIRIPVAARLSYYVSDVFILRPFYRFYWDNFGLKGHTAAMEIPIRIHRFFSVYPQYRIHYQYGHEYFAPKGQHSVNDIYYTSDYDVSDLTTHYFSCAIKWTPYFKNRNNRDNRLIFKNIQLQGGYYTRSDGFSSWLVSGGFSWSVLRKEK